MNIFPLGPSGGPGGGPFDDINDQLGGFFNPTVNTASVARLEVNAGETLDHFQVDWLEADDSHYRRDMRPTY
jgi:hypothetical protein